MDVDIVKASPCAAGSSDSCSMDMMAMMMMMMPMEKFPDDLSSISDPFYTTTANDFSNSTITPPTFSNPAPPSLANPIPPRLDSAHLQIPFQQTIMSPASSNEANKKNSMAAMREMIFRVAVMQPVHIDPESIKPPKRRNVRISKDPQSVAARHRRERISERIRILQRLVPGGTKMDTASMLDEAIHYVKFLKKQVQTLQDASASGATATTTPSFNNNINIFNSINVAGFTGFLGANNNNNNNVNYSAFVKGCHHQPYPMVGSSASKQLLS